MVHQVCRALSHPAPAAGRAEAATLARERDEFVLAATGAVQARESVGKDAALVRTDELTPDMTREAGATLVLLDTREEGEEVL